MNSDFYSQYKSLISDLQIYIQNEHAGKTYIVAGSDNYRFFKEEALQAKPSIPHSVTKPAQAAVPQESHTAPQRETAKVKPIVADPTTNVPNPKFDVPRVQHKPLPIEEKPLQEIHTPPQKSLKRELPEDAKKADFTDMHRLWQKEFPQHPLVATPSDDKAKAILRSWQTSICPPDVSLLYFNENVREKSFLENLAAAISSYFAPARLVSAHKIEAQHGWQQVLNSQNLKMVISHHHSLYSLPNLQQYYSEDSVRGNHTLGKVPLLLLSDLSLYMQEPKLKISLWHTLCQRLAYIKK